MPSMSAAQFTDADLFLAYRHAKLALFQERGIGRLELAEAERELTAVLRRVRRGLIAGEGWFSAFPIGTAWVLPKKSHTAEPSRPVTRIADDGPATVTKIDIRLHLQPSVEFAEVLWLWAFGPALELLLNPAARANRLWLTNDRTMVDRRRRGPFQYWPAAYEKFREEGLDAARNCLSGTKGACIVATLDFANYYDEIDPNFLLSGQFVAQVASRARTENIPLMRRSTSGRRELYCRPFVASIPIVTE